MTNTMNAPWFSIIKTLASQLPPMGGYLTDDKETQDIKIKIQAAKDRYNKQIADKKAYIRNLKRGGAAYNREKPELDRLIRNKNAQLQPLLSQLRATRFRASQQQKPSQQQTPNWMQGLKRTQGNLSPQQQLSPRPTQPTQPQTQQTQQTVPLPRTQPQITNVGGGQAGLENPLLMEKPKQKLSPEQEASIRSHMRFLEAKILEAQNSPNKNIKTDTYEKALEESKNRLKNAGLPVQR